MLFQKNDVLMQDEDGALFWRALLEIENFPQFY